MQQIELRPMLAADIEAVMLVEKSAYEFPWTKGIFADCLRVGYDCIVATEEEQIIGHAVLSVAVDESHILNLTVDKIHQGKGIGKQLLRHLIDLARIKSAQTVLLEARPSNKTAIHIYESAGFNEIGCRKAYYPAPGGKEDALIFALQL
jgi:[ribosomal protein S18]-alanine N-acetyltransferase